MRPSVKWTLCVCVCVCTLVCVLECECTCHMCTCISWLISCEHSQTLTIQRKLTANMASVAQVWSEFMLMIRELGLRQAIWHHAAVFNLVAMSLKEWVPKAAPGSTSASEDTSCCHLHSVEHRVCVQPYCSIYQINHINYILSKIDWNAGFGQINSALWYYDWHKW